MISPRSFILPALQALSLISGVFSAPTSSSASAPLVIIDHGTFQGFDSAGDTESFLGIPFAEPPVGQLRFSNPVPPQPFSGVRNATRFGNACPQKPPLGLHKSLPDNPGLAGATHYIAEILPQSLAANASEDCLYLNVVRPAHVSEGAGLPVIVWIYGGAFEYADSSPYNGTQIVSRSVSLNSPVIYVSFNYRVNAFGFLGGKEVQADSFGNWGLHDQRLALQWVQKYIHLFGGNPEKVVLWGQSAGSVSVMLQMVAYDGQLNGLFRGAVMESGAASPIDSLTSKRAQDNYDFLVAQTNCTSANSTLDCLREAPYQTILDAVLQTPPLLSYQALDTPWRPLVDGVFLKRSVRQLLNEGEYARVPTILGGVDDEGTLFSLYSLNVTTSQQFEEYIQTNFLVGTTKDEIQELGKLYPDNPSLGSPYDVGTNDTLSPEYKRISSFQGDYFFQVPRRYAASHLSRTQDVWGFLWKRGKYVPGVGSFHASDLQEFYDLTGTTDWIGTDALVNFAYNLNPNVPPNGYPSGSAPSMLTHVDWPRYDPCSPQLLTFEDPNVITFTNDTFRAEAIAFLDGIQDRLRL